MRTENVPEVLVACDEAGPSNAPRSPSRPPTLVRITMSPLPSPPPGFECQGTIAARRGAPPLAINNASSGAAAAVTSGVPNGSATPRPVPVPPHALAATSHRHHLIFTGHCHLPNEVGNGPVENDASSGGGYLPFFDEGEA